MAEKMKVKYVIDGVVRYRTPSEFFGIHLNHLGIEQVKIPKGIRTADFRNNNLKFIDLPEGLTTAQCENNNISELKLPQSIQYISCEDNMITELLLPENVNWVHCDLMDNIEEQYKEGMDMWLYQKK